MKRIRIIAAAVTVASLAYIVLYWMVFADWAAMHYRAIPAALHSLVAWPAFCYSSALLVGSPFNNVGESKRVVRLVKVVNIAALALHVLMWATVLPFPSSTISGLFPAPMIYRATSRSPGSPRCSVPSWGSCSSVRSSVLTRFAIDGEGMQRAHLPRLIRIAGSLCIHLAEKWLE